MEISLSTSSPLVIYSCMLVRLRGAVVLMLVLSLDYGGAPSSHCGGALTIEASAVRRCPNDQGLVTPPSAHLSTPIHLFRHIVPPARPPEPLEMPFTTTSSNQDACICHSTEGATTSSARDCARFRRLCQRILCILRRFDWKGPLSQSQGSHYTPLVTAPLRLLPWSTICSDDSAAGRSESSPRIYFTPDVGAGRTSTQKQILLISDTVTPSHRRWSLHGSTVDGGRSAALGTCVVPAYREGSTKHSNREGNTWQR